MAIRSDIDTSADGGVQPTEMGRRSGHCADSSGWKGDRQKKRGEQLAQQLGWLSLGLGLVEMAAPRRISEFMGIGDEGRLLLRICGLREIANGLGILSQHRPARWVGLRIAGDVVDVALLSAAFTQPCAKRERIAAATAVVAGVTALDWLCLQQLNGQPGSTVFEGEARPVKKSIIVNRSPEDVYRFWRDFQNLPRFMNNIISVRTSSEQQSHWVVQAPGGTTVEWEAEIISDQPNELIAWRTLEGSGVKHSGSVHFRPAPGNRGTIVDVEMQYHPPGGVIGATLATFMGKEPGQQVQEDLRRFKQVLETGEIVRSEGSLLGTGLRQQRPGQPPASVEQFI